MTKYYSIPEVASKLGINSTTLTNWGNQHKVESPERVGGYSVYSANAVNRIKRQINSRGFFHSVNGVAQLSLHEIANELKVCSTALPKLVRRGYLPQGSQGNQHKRYTLAEADELKRLYINRPITKSKQPANKAEEAGLYSQCAAARKLGINTIKIHHRIKKGVINPPTHRFGNAVYYTLAEVQELGKVIPGCKAIS